MRRLVIIALSILCTLFVSTSVLADPIEIENYEKLQDYSIKESDTLILNEGDYSIISEFNMRGEDYESLTINNASTSLMADNTGGSGTLFTLDSFTLGEKGGNITSYGGNGKHVHGIYVFGLEGLIQGGGRIEAKGGSGNNAVGIYVENNLEQYDGNIKATGGSAKYAYGIHVYGSEGLTQNSGNIEAEGGSGKRAYGIYVSNSLSQESDNSIITAMGGNGKYAYGIWSKDFTQNKGSVIAIGGTGEKSYGIWVENSLKISNLIIIAREGETASIYVDCLGSNNDRFVMLEGSILTPIVDLNKSDTLASGLIVSRVNITIEDDVVTLAPTMQNTYSLTKDESMTVMLLKSQEATIDGDFMDPDGTITLDYDIEKKNSDSEYYLTITRDNTPKEIFEKKGADKNYVNLVDKLYNLLTEDDTAPEKYPLLVKILDDIDNSKKVKGAIDSIHENILPASSQLTWGDVNIREFNNNQTFLSSKLNTLSVEESTLWYDFSLSFGENDGDEELIQTHYLGFAGLSEHLGIAAQFQFMNGYIAKDKAFSEGTASGAIFLLRYDFNTSKLFDPKMDFIAGYMDNRIIGGMKQNSHRFGFSLNNTFNVTAMTGIDVKAGLNYTKKSFKAYEDGIYYLPANEFDSLALNVGLGFVFSTPKGLSANIHGYMNMELLEDNNSFEDNLQELRELYAVALELNGTSKISYGVGAKLTYMPSSGVGVDLGYDLYVSNSKMTHKIKAGFDLQF